MTEVGIAPEELTMQLCEAFRQNGGMIIDRKEINTIIKLEPDCEACWKMTHEICTAELESFKLNDISVYKDIDRTAIARKFGVDLHCKQIARTEAPDLEKAYYLAVDMNQRSAQTMLPTFTSFFSVKGRYTNFGVSNTAGGGLVNMELKSRLKFWIWKKTNEASSHVYIEAIPVSGEIEAAPGASIGYAWWRQTTGEPESRLAKHFLFLLQEMEYKRKGQPESRQVV